MSRLRRALIDRREYEAALDALTSADMLETSPRRSAILTGRTATPQPH
jgi:hypothetical protein